jgi:predicted nucleic acid-binding protein
MIFARHDDISPYAAAYLSLAENHRIPLATADASPASAARDLGVDVIS